MILFTSIEDSVHCDCRDGDVHPIGNTITYITALGSFNESKSWKGEILGNLGQPEALDFPRIGDNVTVFHTTITICGYTSSRDPRHLGRTSRQWNPLNNSKDNSNLRLTYANRYKSNWISR